jgi:hypothetical protein
VLPGESPVYTGDGISGTPFHLERILALDKAALSLRSLKSRLIFPIIAATVRRAFLSSGLYSARGVLDQDFAGRAESGAVGL